MMEQEQFDPLAAGAGGYVAQPLRLYETRHLELGPEELPYRDSVKNLRPGRLRRQAGLRLGGRRADFIVVNMVAEAVSGSKTPKEAMERAQKRAERYYKV
jgi:multiple sugar transport system substrate-binding protein